MMIEHCLIEEQNLSHAWAKAFLKLMSPGVREIQPLLIIINKFESNIPIEDSEIREAVDNSLKRYGKSSCHTVANTIFPKSLWNQNIKRDFLYKRYLEILPRLRKCPKNRYGLYFERLINFGQERPQKNQIEHIIKTYLGGNHRRSALLASIINPYVDHTHQKQRGFPCLQQVSFTPFGNGSLSIIGTYATQHIFERAYGNYLGLCRLGHFMANEMGLELKKMICFTSIAKLGINKYSVRALEQEVNDIIT
jgi:thymidylate synthase